MTLYLLQYNNYYNRIVKKETSLVDYLRYVIEGGSSPNPLLNTNFNPNDGIFAEHIINWAQGNPNPDYVIVADEYNDIVSRWFVIEQTRLRNGQYRIMLRRDVIVDNYNDILNAPLFVEKATLPTSNPLIHNSENMTYNQILQQKYELTDDTRIPWVVGYVPRDALTSTDPIPVVAKTDSTVDIEVSSISSWDFFKYSNLATTRQWFHPYPNNPYFTVRLSSGYFVTGAGVSIVTYSNWEAYMNTSDYNVYSWETVSQAERRPLHSPQLYFNARSEAGLNKNTVTSRLFTNLRTQEAWDRFRTIVINSSSNIHTLSQTNTFLGLDGKSIRDTTTGLIYSIKITQGTIDDQFKNENVNVSSNTGINIESWFRSLTGPLQDTNWLYETNNSSFAYSTDEIPYHIELTVEGRELQVKPTTNRYHLEDAPYDMFAIPAGSIDVYNGSTGQRIESTIETAAAIATAIGAQTGSASIYDIQLLPYCPVRYLMSQLNELTVTGQPVWPVVDSDNQTVNIILWATKSSDKFKISRTINVPSDPIEYKVANECDFNRLVSPNGAGMFEFKPTTNGGVNWLEVDFTYKPFNPFIHLRPNFGNLYGKNYDKDFRGLICGGDFSVPQLSNAWANYQQNNVNYQAIFNRQIENMEVNNAVQREKEAWSVATSAIGTGVSAGIGSGMAGLGLGSIGVGMASAGLSAIAGMKDIELNEKLRQEALDFTKDQFGYQLGNIQALPTSLAKTGALVYNNTIFPTLEYYSCTEAEKDALRDKLYYNGMTVMAIGTINQHISEDNYTYIKGKLIRCETINDDFHMVNAISGELDKGVFI